MAGETTTNPFAPVAPSFGTVGTANDAARLAYLSNRKEELESILSSPKTATNSEEFKNAKSELAQINSEIKQVKTSIAASKKKTQKKTKTAEEIAAESKSSLEWIAQQEAAAKQRIEQQAAAAREEAERAEAVGKTQEAANLRQKALNIESPQIAAPSAIGGTVAAGATSGKDWSHGLKVPEGKILWQNADGSWSKNQSILSISEAIRKNKTVATRVRDLLIRNGYNPGDFTGADALNNVTAAWGEFANKASQAGVSPFDYKEWAAENLPEWAQQGGAAGGAGGGGGAGGTRTNITIQDPRNLQQSINQVWNTYLKRDATWQEIKDVTEFVNKRIKETPSTTTYDASGSSVTRGLDAGAIGAIIINYAKSRPEAKAQKGEDFEGWIDDNAGGIKFATLVNDPGLDAVRRLYMVGNEADALRALKQLGSVKGAEESELAGKLATAKQNLSAYATAMGVAFDVDSAAKAVVDGLATDEDYKSQIKELAKSYFPAWAKQIDAGQTMQSIAYPYLNSMAQILELNPAEVNVNDPMVKKALTFRDKDGNAASQSIWDFEQSLRKDPRWAYTKNARSELDSATRSVLRDFGLGY